jgi:serine/threonine-protein kinase RsbW
MSAAESIGPITDFVLELPSDPGAIERTVEYVMGQCAGCSVEHKRLRLNFRVGLSEALANAILYGNAEDPSKRVRLEVTVELRRVEARVTDEGTGFDPAGVPDPTEPAYVSRTHGRGLFLMRALMDEVRFNERGNSVTLILRANPAAL